MMLSHDQFMLDPDVTFLNHGSYGACPREVFESYLNWQRELERQPVEFMGRRVSELLDTARQNLAAYIGASADDVVFVPNATTGINLVAKSLHLEAGDQVLATDHEYGACQYTWEHYCRQSGAVYVSRPVSLPLTTPDAMSESFWEGVTPRTRVIFISHITSPTALVFPIAEICARARQHGMITVIDGAHAPGQVPLDLTTLDPDFYTGNCHKWMCAPKGSGFLYVRRDLQAIMQPQIISWGEADGSFIARQQQQGTRDYAAYLTVPDAIAWQRDHDWKANQEYCHALVVEARAQLADLFKLPPIAPADWNRQMVTARLPVCDVEQVKTRLYDDYRVEIPGIDWNNEQYIRVAIQGYNTAHDIDRLIAALTHIFQ